MKNPTRILLLTALLIMTACGSSSETGSKNTAAPTISGRIEQGLRVLTIDPAATDQHFRIHRGDYVRPEQTGDAPFTLEIPALEVSLAIPAPAGQRPYFKVPKVGVFEFRCGEASGTIEAVELQSSGYREVTSREAVVYISERQPLILDVRTPGEYAGGHLTNAVLIPVQVLQSRLSELAADKDRPIFIYCRTGNRSTVAAKLLMDAGHTEVVNLRRGIVEWQHAGLPVVK
ncbi:hypothetical protein DRQ50_12385 [bacterium]|nr:MAG: hypothetical protein DRQ50_12385 [bacterium]